MNYYFRKQSSETVIKKIEFTSGYSHAHNLVSSFPVGVQIGFERTSYTAHEGDKSVTVCAVKTAKDIVTLLFFTADGLSAQFTCYMHTHAYLCILESCMS